MNWSEALEACQQLNCIKSQGVEHVEMYLSCPYNTAYLLSLFDAWLELQK
jgi:hypothetical protein